MKKYYLNILFILAFGFIRSQTSDSSFNKAEGPQKYGGHDNGQVIIEGKFKEGSEKGIIEFKSEYNKKKQLVREGSFKKKKFWSGEEYFYDKEGKLIRVKKYNEGKYIGDADLPH
ncbi:MAG: hypothetical protein K0S32_3463 [Bacteroidetes bacterium]|jgi:hypothetical protein|nr:hypothetical protein [Bacteroidota bacterium]